MQKRFSIICVLIMLVALAQSQPDQAADLNHEPAHGAQTAATEERYHVVFNYEVKNKTSRELKSVKVFFPVPFNDKGQTVTNLALNRSNQLVHNHSISDQFGQEIVQADIDSIKPRESTTVGFSCDVAIHPVRVDLEGVRPVSQDTSTPDEVRKLYTGDIVGAYDIFSSLIQKRAAELLQQYPDPVARVIAIHDMVAGGIKYNMSGGWESAPVVLKRGSGSCSEYSFAFASLCRATGLPTRLVGSSHLRTTTDFPYKDTAWHRWIEVYLPGLEWVPFDPTLDRGKQPLRTCCGSYDFRTLRVSRGGCESNVLGTSYVGRNDHQDEIERDPYFVWYKL